MTVGNYRYLAVSSGLILVSMPHWGVPLLQPAVAGAIGCETLSACGPGGRMLWLWLISILPLIAAVGTAAIVLLSPGARSGGLLVWLSCLVGALAPVTGGVSVQFLATSLLILFGLSENRDHPHLGALAFVPFATGLYPLLETGRSLLVPAAGINILSRNSAIELSFALRDMVPERPDVSPFTLTLAGVLILAGLAWSRNQTVAGSAA